jgi:hypothetical protein
MVILIDRYTFLYTDASFTWMPCIFRAYINAMCLLCPCYAAKCSSLEDWRLQSITRTKCQKLKLPFTSEAKVLAGKVCRLLFLARASPLRWNFGWLAFVPSIWFIRIWPGSMPINQATGLLPLSWQCMGAFSLRKGNTAQVIPVDFFFASPLLPLFLLRIWTMFMEGAALASPGVDGVARDSGHQPRVA